MQPLTWNEGFAQDHIVQIEFHQEKKDYKKAHPKHHPISEFVWGVVKQLV